jgi:5-methylcytosine-specific restriction endonuclease McrA
MNEKRMDDKIRRRVFQRDHYTCRYCGNTRGPFHADHVYPYVKGGETTPENMVTACERCNRKKHDKVGVYPLPVGYFNKPKTDWINVSLIASIAFLLIYTGFVLGLG